MPRKVHVTTIASLEEKDNFKKKVVKILVDMQQQQQDKAKKGFTIVSLEESFIFYDSLVKRVWIDKEKRPVVRITGSHKNSSIFGVISMEEGKKQK